MNDTQAGSSVTDGNAVGVVRGTDKYESFRHLLDLSKFNDFLMQEYGRSQKPKSDYRIVIKPNMMVFVNPKGYEAVVTDHELVEFLVDHIRALGFENITLCEAQHDIARILKNHNVAFVAEQIGYKPEGRYRVADLTLESETFAYTYRDGAGRTRRWKDKVGRSWKEADFRISFAKCKTHEHDWMTLAVKNIYGCFPRSDKVCRYHIRKEIFDVTAWSYANLPVHFSFVDAWIASDGFQGYKIPRPEELRMLFGGRDGIAVDMEIFKRAGLDPMKSRILRKCVEQTSGGSYPQYTVRGDVDTTFGQLCKWENVSDKTVETIDILEEVYIAWGFINLKAGGALIDYSLFPPRNIISRISVWLIKKLYGIFKLTRLYKKLYGRD